MKKVIVIGSPGAGKSTFARKLRDKTKLPLYYLDQIWHRSDRTNITKEEFDTRLSEILATDQWIIDGNYGRTLEMRLKACDTVFCLTSLLKYVCKGSVNVSVKSTRIYLGRKQRWMWSSSNGSQGSRTINCRKLTLYLRSPEIIET